MSVRVVPPAAEQQDPFDFYAEMRRDHPVAHDEEHDVWAAFRYDDVRTVLSDWRLFTSEFHRFPEVSVLRRRRLRESLLSTDPPRHAKLRAIVSKAFTPRAVAELEPRIRAIAEDLLSRLAPSGRMELVADLSYPLPATVIAELLGLPAGPEDLARYRRWAGGLLAGDRGLLEGEGSEAHPDDLPERTREEMDGFFRAALAERQAGPRQDLMTALLVAEVDGERLAEAEAVSFCELLLLAGHVTTTNLLANAVIEFLARPGTWERLRDRRQLVGTAVEEVLRFNSPVQALARITARDVDLGGRRIPAGRLVLAWLGSADRDETRFPDAGRFDVARDPNPHVAFGHGVHT